MDAQAKARAFEAQRREWHAEERRREDKEPAQQLVQEGKVPEPERLQRLMTVEEIDAATQPAQQIHAVAEAKEPRHAIILQKMEPTALVQQQEVLAALTLTRT